MNFSTRIQSTNNLYPGAKRCMQKYYYYPHNHQSGEGLLDSAFQRLKRLPKFAKKAVDAFASPLGNTITNTASQLISNNPNQRPGFPGEKHIFMNTPHGFTKSNYAGRWASV